MKHRFLLTLVIAALVAGIWLLWFEGGPSTEPKITAAVEERFQPGPDNPMPPLGRGERINTQTRTLFGDRESNTAQTNNSAADDALVSNSLKPDRVDGVAIEFPEENESAELVIGGYVQDEDGNPLSGIGLRAEWAADSDGSPIEHDWAAENMLSTFSDPDGAFLFTMLEHGEYRVRLAPVPGVAPAEVTVRVGTLNANLVVVTLQDIRVYGTVRSTEGEAIEGVHIIAGPTTRSTHTGSRGEYELEISWQGNKVVPIVNFQHENFALKRIRIDPADLDGLTGDYQLDVSMEPRNRRTTVKGRLTDPEGGPVSGKNLHIVTSQTQILHSALSDSRGNFLFGDVEPGEDYQLLIRPGSGYKNKDINPLVVPVDGLTLDIVLDPSERGSFSGWMIDLDGNPVPGFSLTLHSTVATGQSVSVVIDQRGFFTVEDFPVGGAMFRTGSYPVLTVQGIRVAPEPEEPITVILDTGAYVLLGWVTNAYGEPVAASSVTLNWEFSHDGLLNSSSRQTTSGQDGDFVFTRLGPGLHTIQVSATGYKTALLTFEVGTNPDELVVELEEMAE